MENGFGLHRQERSVWRSFRDGDFEEEDVWDVLKDHKKLGNSVDSSISKMPRNIPSAAKMIPNCYTNTNISKTNNSLHELTPQSAPVNIPEWPKIHRPNKSSNNSGFDDDDDEVASDGDEDDDEYKHKIPPHEVIARRLARSQISSFSVFEGAGRTLKGRDLSKVRNAVLNKTGFLESL